MKNEHALYTKELREEAAHLRVQWDQQVDSLNAKIRQYETAIERQQSDIRSQAEQRMDDLSGYLQTQQMPPAEADIIAFGK